LEERHIGPSLGEQSIYQGLISCLAGFLILFVFAVSMYKLPGFFAFIALVLNLLLTLFALSFMHATLTLPGIAGLVLSIGMAIDASILIYERIKEELTNGAALKTAIAQGFSGALAVILDANITHFIVSIVLYYLGTGPVQGFAVTMLVGIVATLLTGVVFLRAMFDFCTHVLGVQKMRF
jgi:protein-export membrane protein SecD